MIKTIAIDRPSVTLISQLSTTGWEIENANINFLLFSMTVLEADE